jgi:hypothetical protein
VLVDGNATGEVLVLSCPDHAVEFVVDGITLQNGNAYNSGGGLFAKTDNGEVTLTNDTISENLGGGGVLASGSTVNFINNTITGNSAGFENIGCGVYAVNSTTVTLTNNIITGNSTFVGGGVYVYLFDNSDKAHIYNNIIYNNTADSYGNDLYIGNYGSNDFDPSIVNLYNNDFDQSASGTYIQIPFSIDPSNLDNLDPLFVDATSGDYHLIEDSPCIDTGSNTAPALPETDKDGQFRIMDSVVDMGAYEYPGSYSYLLKPVHRLWCDWGAHFYYMGEEEDYITDNLPCHYGGIAWYAYPTLSR